MNNRIIFILLIILIILAAGFVWTALSVQEDSVTEAPITVPSTTNDPNGLQPETMGIKTRDGESVFVRDIRNLPTTRHFSDNVIEYYSFAESKDQDGIPNYEIQYSPKGQDIQIYITNRPAAALRRDAEHTLLALLGITQQEACRLSVYVNVPGNVDPFFAGQNLGLSFCPGSVELPE